MYWTYENWIHRYARVHLSQCAFCNDGLGSHGALNSRAGRWIDKFENFDDAMEASKFITTPCGHCAPENGAICRRRIKPQGVGAVHARQREFVADMSMVTDEFAGFEFAGFVEATCTNLPPQDLPPKRQRHQHGHGPFAKLKMPLLPDLPGLYLWAVDGDISYIGQTRRPLRARLGANGYSSISNYNTFARQLGRRNGGQETNCRINALANAAITEGGTIAIWYRVTAADDARAQESLWMQRFGIPPWNRRDER